jgi:hypothetical protein
VLTALLKELVMVDQIPLISDLRLVMTATAANTIKPNNKTYSTMS